MGRFEAGSGAQLRHALGVVIVKAVVLMMLFAALVGSLGEAPWEEPSLALVLALAGTLAVDDGLVVGVGLLVLGRLHAGELGWCSPRATDLALGLAGGALSVVGLLAVVGLWWGPHAAGEIGRAALGWSPTQRLIFTCIGVGAALGEETVFRGYLQPGLQRRLGRGAAIVLTAAIFSLYHLQFHAVGLLGKFWVGLVYGALRQSTGRLWAPGLAHAAVWVSLGAL
jgi:membrane protease YdiL (CAAX protease family)